MTSTFTPSLNLELPGRNDYINDWDIPNNSNFTAIDGKVGGTQTIAVTNANLVLTRAQSQCANLVFTGSLSAAIGVYLPAGAGGIYSVLNGTIGNQPIYLQTTAGGAALGLSPGIRYLVISDGANVYLADQSGMPPGAVLPFLSPTIPGGFILSYGQVLPQASQPGIFAAYGATFNQGNEGGGNFRMPDLRGVVLAGLDNMGGAARGLLTNIVPNMGATGGEQNHALSVAELASHGHGITDPQHTHTASQDPHTHGVTLPNSTAGAQAGNGAASSSNQTFQTQSTTPAITVTAASTGITVNAAGSGAAHNNLQPTMFVNLMVKT